MRPPTPRTALAAVLLALLATLLPATPVHAQSVDRYQQQARVVTNNKRVNHDVVALKKRRCVQRFARRQAQRMANQQRMFHQDLGVVMSRCGLSRAGENVAMGYPTGRRVVRAWMHSPGHRANLLEPSYRIMGLAVRRDDQGRPYAAQVFGRH